MNNTARMMLQKKMMDKRRYDKDNRDYNDSRTYRISTGHSDMRRDYNDSRDYNNNYSYNDNHDYNDRRDYNDNRDYNDMRRDGNDFGHDMYRLSKEDMHEWAKNLESEDGIKGPKFNVSQMMSAAEKVGVHFNKFDEQEFCIVANMLYSDLGADLRNYIPPEKEAIEYAKLARSWLNDRDSSAKNSEKLALYYNLIVKK